MSNGSGPSQLAAAVSTDADGSSRVGSQWLTDPYQSGSEHLSLSLFNPLIPTVAIWVQL